MTTAPRLIALCSPSMGSGKSEVAGRLLSAGQFLTLQRTPLKGFQLVKFAGPLKRMGAALLRNVYSADTVEEMLEGSLKEVPLPAFLGMSPRRILQTIGTEWGRHTVGSTLWVNLAMAEVDRKLAEGYSVVMDDLRFLNEMDAVLARDGVCYRVTRPGNPSYAPHESEGELDKVEMPTILNDGSLMALHAKADQLVMGVN